MDTVRPTSAPGERKPWARLQGRRGFIPGIQRADLDLIKAHVGRNTRGAGAQAVYVALARLINDSRREYPDGVAVPIPINTLAEAAGLPRRTTIRCRIDLVNIGLLRLEQQRPGNGPHPFDSSLHTLTPTWTPRGACQRGTGGRANDSARHWHDKERSPYGASEEESLRAAQAGQGAGHERAATEEETPRRVPRRFDV